MNSKQILPFAALLSLTCCANVIEGRSQEITVQSNPVGATCTLTRNNVPLGTVVTPGSLYLEKTKDDIAIECRKAGYKSASIVNKSGYPKNNWLYILVGGPIGWGVDSASGADNLYASPVTVDLNKK